MLHWEAASPPGASSTFYGSESSGKTSLALAIAGQVQKMDGTVAFIDVEHSMDPLHAQRMGCDLRQLIVNQPQTMEEALAVVEKLARGGVTNLVVVRGAAVASTSTMRTACRLLHKVI